MPAASPAASGHASAASIGGDVVACHLHAQTAFGWQLLAVHVAPATSLLALDALATLALLSVMREMRQPRRFGVAVHSATLGMVFVYCLAVAIGYGSQGSQVADFLPDSLANGPAKAAVGFLLAMHAAVCYLLIGQPLHRAAHGFLFPQPSAVPGSPNRFPTDSGGDSGYAGGFGGLGGGSGPPPARHRGPSALTWLVVTVLVLTLSVAVATAVPSFGSFQSLLGAVTGTPSIFGWPPLFFLRATAQRGAKPRELERALCMLSLTVLLPGFGLIGAANGVQDVRLHWQYSTPLEGC